MTKKESNTFPPLERRSAPPPSPPKVGDPVKYKGVHCRITSIYINNKCAIRGSIGTKTVDISEVEPNPDYILCSAIYYQDEKKYKHQPHNITTGYVVCGRRHHNCMTTLAIHGVKLIGKHCIQGFLTSDNIFVTREHASAIAYNAGQIRIKQYTLVSEDLW